MLEVEDFCLEAAWYQMLSGHFPKPYRILILLINAPPIAQAQC